MRNLKAVQKENGCWADLVRVFDTFSDTEQFPISVYMFMIVMNTVKTLVVSDSCLE